MIAVVYEKNMFPYIIDREAFARIYIISWLQNGRKTIIYSAFVYMNLLASFRREGSPTRSPSNYKTIKSEIYFSTFIIFFVYVFSLILHGLWSFQLYTSIRVFWKTPQPTWPKCRYTYKRCRYVLVLACDIFAMAIPEYSLTCFVALN